MFSCTSAYLRPTTIYLCMHKIKQKLNNNFQVDTIFEKFFSEGVKIKAMGKVENDDVTRLCHRPLHLQVLKAMYFFSAKSNENKVKKPSKMAREARHFADDAFSGDSILLFVLLVEMSVNRVLQ